MGFVKGTFMLMIGLGLSVLVVFLLIGCLVALNTLIPPKPPEEEGYPTWSPDGKRIAFICYLDGPTERVMESDLRQYSADAADICVINEGSTNRIRLTVNEVADFYPAWSPDGARIAYTSRDGIYIINADGSQPRRLVDTSNLSHLYELGAGAWAPDGKYLAFSACLDGQERDIYLVKVDNGELTNLTSGNLALDGGPIWLPDSQQLMFVSSPSPIESCSGIPSAKSYVKLINIDGAGERTIFDIETFYGSLAIAPVTGQIAFTANVEADNDRENLIFDPYLFTMQLGEDKPKSWGKVHGFLTWSPDGRYLAYTSTSLKVILLDIETGVQRELPSTFSPGSSLTWSADGQELAITVTEQIEHVFFVKRILIYDLNTNSIRPLIQR